MASFACIAVTILSCRPAKNAVPEVAPRPALHGDAPPAMSQSTAGTASCRNLHVPPSSSILSYCPRCSCQRDDTQRRPSDTLPVLPPTCHCPGLQGLRVRSCRCLLEVLLGRHPDTHVLTAMRQIITQEKDRTYQDMLRRASLQCSFLDFFLLLHTVAVSRSVGHRGTAFMNAWGRRWYK